MATIRVFFVIALALWSRSVAQEFETITGTIYCDNNFTFFINGEIIAQDPVETFPHNAHNSTFTILKDEAVVFAITARDWSDETTGLEYDNRCLGDGGLRAMFSNGVVTNATWKCWTSLYGPVNWQACYAADPRDAAIKVLPSCKAPKVPPFEGCYTRMREVPTGWATLDFDATSWEYAIEYDDDFVGWGLPPTGCNNATVYVSPDTDSNGDPLTCPQQIDWSFYGDSKFIWRDDLDLDNFIHCRYVYREHLLTREATGSAVVSNFTAALVTVFAFLSLIIQ